MSSLKIETPETTDLTLPIRRDDPILTNGSLLLLQPKHSVTPWPSGVLANGTLLPNLAEFEARALIPTGDLSAKIGLVGNLNDGVRGIVERTAKGGLHAIVSQTAWTGDHAMAILVADAVRDYLCAQSGHDYYISDYGAITRPAVAGATQAMPYMCFGRYASGDIQGAWTFCQALDDSVTLPKGANRKGEYHSALNVAGPRMFAIAGKPSEAMSAANYVAEGNRNVAQWGAMLPYSNGAGVRQRLPSWVMYRTYVEDLTVSGRTYAQVLALDQAIYTKEVLTAGGYYYGDTFTNPSVLP